MPYNSIRDETQKGTTESEGMQASGSSSGSTGSFITPETIVEAWDRINAKLDHHRQWLENIGAELASTRHEPGPYAELTGRLKALEDGQDILRRLQEQLGTLVGLQTTPDLTVRHWLSPEGKWLYETVVRLKPETAEAMGNTLGWVDDMARQESRRREQADARERSREGTQSYG